MVFVEKYILTIDQGTTSSRAILFDSKANCINKYQMEFTQIHRKPGFVEHNANEIYETVLECIKNVLNNSNIDPKDIKGIAITNPREIEEVFEEHPELRKEFEGKKRRYYDLHTNKE